MIPTSLTPGATVSAQDRSDVIDLVNRLNMAFDVWDLQTMLGLHTEDFTIYHPRGVATGHDQLVTFYEAYYPLTVGMRRQHLNHVVTGNDDGTITVLSYNSCRCISGYQARASDRTRSRTCPLSSHAPPLPPEKELIMSIVKGLLVRKATVEAKVRRGGNRRNGSCSHQEGGSALALVLGLVAWTLGGGYGVALAQTASDSFSSPLVAGPDAAAKQADAYYDDYRFRNGETLARLRLHYATLGSPHRNSHGDIDNAVLVLHWTGSGGSALLTPEYVRALFAPGRPLDARRYYLIIPDNLGHGNSSKPSDGMRAGFPHYGYGDLVDLQHKLVTETLGVQHLHAILGMSMGGMNCWQWAEAYPDAMDGVMPVVSLPVKVSGRNLLWRRMVIADIRNDPEWQGGNYAKQPLGLVQGYQLLRLMIDGVPHLQAIISDANAADGFMAAAAQQIASADANDLLYSLESSRDYDPEPGLSKIKTKLLALNFSDDEFNPDMLQILQHLTPRVPGGRYVVQNGTPESFGHLTMAHPALWADHVRDFMEELGEPPPIQAIR